MRIRRATAEDAAAIASIYAPYVCASVVSFELARLAASPLRVQWRRRQLLASIQEAAAKMEDAPRPWVEAGLQARLNR